MKMKKIRSVLGILLLSMVVAGCGSDNKSGGGGTSSSTTFNGSSTATGDAGSVITVEELKAAILGGKFDQGSTANVYYFQKETGSVYDSCWFGKYDGNFDEKYGARALNTDNSITRNFTINRNGCNVTLSFDQDPFTGNSLQALANSVVAKINTALSTHDAINNPTVRKVFSAGTVNYYPSNYTCQIYDSLCSSYKSTSSKVWEIRVNGEWLRIDLTSALIRQPTYRY